MLWGPSAMNPMPFSQHRYMKGPAWARYSTCAQIPSVIKQQYVFSYPESLSITFCSLDLAGSREFFYTIPDYLQ